MITSSAEYRAFLVEETDKWGAFAASLTTVRFDQRNSPGPPKKSGLRLGMSVSKVLTGTNGSQASAPYRAG
jgi:hypothetical protein